MVLRKPLWSSGYLYPPHLQQQDRYHERALALRLQALSPYHWGVIALELDARAVQAGQIAVSRLEAILPDGSYLAVGEAFGEPLPPRPIEGFAGAVERVDVHVGIAQEREDVPCFDAATDVPSVARYVARSTQTNDMTTGGDAREVRWLLPNVRLVFGTEARDRFDSVRIAQLVRAPSGSIVLQANHVPAVLSVGASPFLVQGFERLLAAVVTKQQSLASTRRQRAAAVVDFQASDAAKFWLLHTLNQCLPALGEIVDKPATIHPREAYGVLAELIASLCTFVIDGDPNAIPRFQYLDLGGVFDAMFQRAHALLEAVIAERFVRIFLERRDPTMHIGQLRDAALFRYNFYLAATSRLPEAQVRDQLPRFSKISSPAQMEALRQSAVNGARLQLEFRPPSALPMKPGVVVFQVEKTKEFWSQIVSTGSIAIYQPVDPANIELALYAVDPTGLA